MCSAPSPRSDAERHVLVEAKLARSDALYDLSKRFDFVLTEWAVRCRVAGPSAMAEQSGASGCAERDLYHGKALHDDECRAFLREIANDFRR